MNSSEIVAVVPLREGSKGLPNKNVMEFNGIPLFLHTVQQALRITEKVFITTNIQDIINAKLPNGSILDKRPKALSHDNVKMSSVISYMINQYKLVNKIILLLQATSPLRSDNDILNTIELFKTNNYDLVFTIKQQKSETLKYGTLENNSYSSLSQTKFLFENRQLLPDVYGHNGAVYLFYAADFLKNGDFPTNNIGAVVMPQDRSIDIDDIKSFIKAENIFKNGKLKN